MYKVSVPVAIDVLERYGAEDTIKLIRSTGAERVFLCPAGHKKFWASFEEEAAKVRKYVDIMKSEGFETGVWVWTFQYEGGDFNYMKSPTGRVSKTSVCPTDKTYAEKIGDFVEAMAKCGIDIFMFDDDYRFSFIDCGYACVCDNHLKMISEELGENVTREFLEKYLTSGGKNKYRDAFVKCNGESLRSFSAEMRRRLDNVNPDIRMGFCSCISQWDIDGAHPDEIAKLLAGNTRPFYRLIGAPYWAAHKFWGNRLGDVIDLERIEASRRKDKNIEIFSEGDTFPRPRFRTPAAYLEGFDTALRAAGCLDGILKYMFDYSAHTDYEQGFIERHNKNKKLYEQIDKMFSGKKSIGVRVYDTPNGYTEITIPEKLNGKDSVQDIAFNAGARTATNCSLPCVYEGDGCGAIAFGKDIRAVPTDKLAGGLIIDLEASRILEEMGVDTGVRSIGETLNADYEIFEKQNNKIKVEGTFYNTVIDEKAVIESRFTVGDESYPASFTYENTDGMKFLVFCYDAYFNSELLSRQYTRADQIFSAIPRLCGKKVPAVCRNNPELYIQVKKNGSSLAVGLWNFCVDSIDEPIVELYENVSVTGTINCTASAEGNKVSLSRIEPFGFAAFEAEIP